MLIFRKGHKLGFLLLLALCTATQCFSSAQNLHFQTDVRPLPTEDIASDCHYKLTLPDPKKQIELVWVIFDRGLDVHKLADDPAVTAFARRFHIALLLHGHCPGKKDEDHNDMNMDPSNGLGRALFAALDQFAQIANHPELSNAKLIYLGFSGAGPLSARLVGMNPSRTVAAILSAPGHYEPMGIDTVSLDDQALAVPQLVMTGSADDLSGTARPYLYFKKHRDRGAPWVFVVQNNSPHCCTANARNLILQWLEAVIKQRQAETSGTALRSMDQRHGWQALIKTRQTKINDSFGLKTFEVVDAKIERIEGNNSMEWDSAGWLPNESLAREWVSFVRKKQHPVLPLR